MPDYAVFVRSAGSLDIRFVTAPDLQTAAQRVRNNVNGGVSATDDKKDRVQIGVVLLAAFAEFDPTP